MFICIPSQKAETQVSTPEFLALVMLCHVYFDLPKIGSPQNEFSELFGPTLKKFFSTIGQPHKRKSVTTKDISGVHSCITRKMNDCFS